MTGGEAHTILLNQLRGLTQTQGGDWTTQRAVAALDGWITHARAHDLLNQLTAEGLLVGSGPVWTAAKPTLTDAEQRAYRDEQDDHIHDEDTDEQSDDEQEEGGE